MIDKDEEFMWYLYLEATKSESVPDVLFQHVEEVIQNGISPGMALEVPIRNDNNDEQYWVALVKMVCGPLLELEYFGCDDKKKRIWFNLTKEFGHELGWCYKNNKKLIPPENYDINQSSIDKLECFIKDAISIPSDMLQGESLNMMTRIKQGMKVEISDTLNPYKLWMATIVKNNGGRLLLRYDTPGSPVKDFWAFCTSELIHDYGFVKKCSSPWFLEPPASIKNNHSSDKWIDFVKSYLLNNPPNTSLFKKEDVHAKHAFKVGMKLEAVSPSNYTNIHPATVINVLDDTYFLVSIDESMKDGTKDTNLFNDASKTWLCTSDHPYIFPKNWAKTHKIQLTLPSGWTNIGEYFDWESYLKETNSVTADETIFYKRESAAELGYENNMYLEAVDPFNASHICAAHITRSVDDLLFVKLDNEDNGSEYIYHIHSPQIFPVGWCETNQYPLRLPKDYKELLQKHRSTTEDEVVNVPERTNLTKIYFNSRCSTGPMISKSKLITLPRSVGPGPVDLVLKEVLTMLVSVGYNSGRVLKVLQCDTVLEPGYNLEMLKVKQKNHKYHASVAVVNDYKMVEEFCRNICKKIMVCPNLFGPKNITADVQCPEKCRKSRGRGKWIRKRGRQANKDKNTSTGAEREGEREDESSTSDISQHVPECAEDDANKATPSCNIKEKLLDTSDDIKNEPITSDTSEGSNNERIKRKESNGDSVDSSSIKSRSSKDNTSPNSKDFKRKHDNDNIETSNSIDCNDQECIQMLKKPKKSKAPKLDTDPLSWTVDEVYNYLRKTKDCKDVADILKKEEIDGMAFLLLNLPTLVEHMKLNNRDALKVCRHIEQVKVAFFLTHANDSELNT